MKPSPPARDRFDDTLARFGERVEAVRRQATVARDNAIDLPVHREQLVEEVQRTSTALLVAMEQLRAAEEELRQQNEALEQAVTELEGERKRYAELFDFAPDGYLVTDTNGLILESNRAAAELLGIAPRFLHRKSMASFVPGGERVAFRASLAAVVRSRDPRQWDLCIRPRRRPHFDAAVTAAPVHDASEQVVAVRWLVRDISERRRIEEHTRSLNAELEQRVTERTRQLEAANRAKTDFLATMSHELRTPINAILGYSELLELGLASPLSAGQQAYVERIQTSARHLIGLVDEVLDLAKVESGTLVTQAETSRASDVVRAAITLVRPQAVAGRIRIVDRCEGLHDAMFLGDDHRVRQILVNLLANAVKFSEPGGRVQVTCSTTTEAPPGWGATANPRWACISVSDTGIGIAPDKLGEVFEPFMQADNGRTRQHGGTGLGLAISRRLARLMAGDLTVRSRASEGSVFTLWLPASDDVAEPRSAPPESEAPSARPTLSSRRGELMLDGMDRIIAVTVARLRADPGIPGAESLGVADLEDHLRTYLTDVGNALNVLESMAGDTKEFIRDGSEIQRLISERHGVQRYRLGWSEESLRREFAILRQAVFEHMRVAGEVIDERREHDALGVLGVMLDLAERVSVRSFRLAASSEIR